MKGRNGVRVYLESYRMGGTNVTSAEALLRFFGRLDDHDPGAGIAVQLPVNKRKPSENARNAGEKQTKEAIEILKHRGVID